MDKKKIRLFERVAEANAKRKLEHRLAQLFWECTLRCNLNCRHCGSDCRVDSLQDDMPFADFEKVLDDIASEISPETVFVITTGGEPLVRRDIVQCGRAISDKGFKWGMVTNGLLLTEEKLDELIDAGLKTIAISLDGFESDHNWMRGHNDSFARAVRAVDALVSREGSVMWDVITCVNAVNFPTLPDFRDFIISRGVRRWRLFTVFPSGRAVDEPAMFLNDMQYRQLMEFITDTKKSGRIKLDYSCEGFLGDYELKVRRYPFFCQAGVNVASVLSDGSLSGCLSIRSDYHQGNIYKDRFMDVWNNRYDIYRNREWKRKGECADCEMWKYCEGNGMHLRSDDGHLVHCNYLILKHTENELDKNE